MRPLKLEVFRTDAELAGGTVVTDLDAMEEARLAAYEQGYSAGWEDAAAAQSEDQSRLRADLAHNLQSLGFTYHEARIHVLRALQPLLLEVAGRLLPEIARSTLAPIVLETLTPLAEAMGNAPIKLMMNPAARPAIEALLDHSIGLPLTLTDEPTLGEGQVYLHLGDTETEVDLDRVISEISTALQDFFTISTKDQAYG